MNTEERKHIEVVAAVICDGNRIFATQRGYGEWKDWWEFPGGKMESGETPEAALQREIREELATEISVENLLTTVDYDSPQLPPNHALLYLQSEKRQPHPPRTRGSQMANARRAKLRQVATGR